MRKIAPAWLRFAPGWQASNGFALRALKRAWSIERLRPGPPLGRALWEREHRQDRWKTAVDCCLTAFSVVLRRLKCGCCGNSLRVYLYVRDRSSLAGPPAAWANELLASTTYALASAPRSKISDVDIIGVTNEVRFDQAYLLGPCCERSQHNLGIGGRYFIEAS